MNKRFLLLALCVIGIGLVASWTGLANRVEAQAASAKEMAPQASPTPQATASSIPVDQQIQALNQKAVEGLQAGWIHILENKTFDRDAKDHGTLPDGRPIPNQQINDIWYHVDEQGLIIESVYIMRTVDGQIVQVGVSSNGSGWNSATGEVTPAEQDRLEGLDGNFLKDLKWLEKSGDTASLSHLSLPDGTEAVQIVSSESFDKPVRTLDYDKASLRAETRALFDTSSGFLISRQAIFWFEDGSQRVYSQLTQKITAEAPTQEVLDYLAQKEK